MSNYTLEIISHHPTFKNKSLRQYYVDGINTVGAWGDEPFEIRFKNNTYQKVQVKLSVDGTDVLTGDLASTEPNSNMWVVNGYGTLSLQAWPETNNGGARFVFTSASNSVAIHTHGDLSNRGIVAAAVFVEGHVEPIRIQYQYPITVQPIWTYNSSGGGSRRGGGSIRGSLGGSVISSNTGHFKCDVSDNLSYNSIDSDTQFCANTNIGDATKILESLVAVGAGQHVDQKITYVSGLIKPTFTETIRIRYMWWDDLVGKLKASNVPAPHASGFPGDREQTNISLGSTPRIGDFKGPSFPRSVEPSYLRV